MRRQRKRERKTRGFALIWLAIPFLAGLLLGWLALGWGALPVSYGNAVPQSLRAADRETFVLLAAETFGASGDASQARSRLESWPKDLLASDIARLQERLWTEDAFRADQVRALAEALGIEQPAAPTVQPSGPVDLTSTENILVLGTDSRPEWPTWRTDTIMVLVVDRKTNRIGVVSIPRDLYVDIPGQGKNRVNAAAYIGKNTNYPGGGPALAQRVIEENVGIPTQHWVLIRMDGLKKLVDALGGVTVNLDCPVYEQAYEETSPTGLDYLILPAGQVRLDGRTAMKFATYRYIEADFGRVRRQQELVWAIRNRALQGNLLPRIPELWQALSDTFTTDLGLPDVIKLAALGARLKSQDVHGLTLGDEVADFTTPEGWQVLVFKDKEAVQEKLSQLFSSKPLSEVGKRSSESEECPPPPFELPAQ
jgi:LCP family protein required for cell wall assembly